MKEFQGTATARVEADPDSVFDLVTDIDQLPQWNAAIECVLDRPDAIGPDAEWVVKMHPRRLPSWRSRSRVDEIDRRRRHFAYRTQTDDGNPSFALWIWDIDPVEGGAQVTVSWHVHPMTLGRQLFAARLRRSQLAREVPASLARISPNLRDRRRNAPPGVGFPTDFAGG